MDYQKEYNKWLDLVDDTELLTELKNMNSAQIEDAFYRDLAFGTGGLRGTIGAGINRMNKYVVAKASQGLANYLRRNFALPSVVIGYDSRIKSDVFAQTAAGVFAANGIKVYIWPELLPVPTVSYAVRYLGASQGVMITASHNPSAYNGYKVYGSDGCQITTETAAEILTEIDRIDIFSDIKKISWESAKIQGILEPISDSVLTDYIEQVKRQSVLFSDQIDKNVSIVYSPLNGTGLVPVTRVLEESGFTNITIVEEQRNPDGEFPTCPYPNPEIKEAMQLGLDYCRRVNADILLATDPDCDRCGIAVRDSEEYVLLSGNEVGLLLLDYVCSQRRKHQKMPETPVFIKTIVTTDLAEKIAKHYGCRTINVLTGFKFIGEQIGYLERQGRENDYICGFEESYGYLTGSYVRDKDGVNAALLICEMFAFYKTRGISLIQKLQELYSTYGYALNTLHSYEFSGSTGIKKMQSVMSAFRRGINSVAGYEVKDTLDYINGIDDLPKSDVIKFILENGSVVVRPSGTEPKLKIYISVAAKDRETAEGTEKRLLADLERMIFSVPNHSGD